MSLESVLKTIKNQKLEKSFIEWLLKEYLYKQAKAADKVIIAQEKVKMKDSTKEDQIVLDQLCDEFVLIINLIRIMKLALTTFEKTGIESQQ